MTTSSKWQAHDAVGYDVTMSARCTSLLTDIVANPARRQAIFTDPRDLHRELFASFTSPSCDQYAGTYRGTHGTALAGRRSIAESQLQPGTNYEFCASGEVTGRMNHLLQQTRDLVGDASVDRYGRLLGLTYTFCWFGKIHPFLDGNGHVQRSLFAAMAAEGESLPLRPSLSSRPTPTAGTPRNAPRVRGQRLSP